VKLFALNKYAVSHILLPMVFYVHSLNCTDITSDASWVSSKKL